nr:hypothetical protein [uncultured Desulfobulbus sp.]
MKALYRDPLAYILRAAIWIPLFCLHILMAMPAVAALKCEPDYQFRTIAVAECEALMTLYQATDGPNWALNSGGNYPWDEDGPSCGMTTGTVKCSDEGGRDRHVVQLNLVAVGMNGVLPGEVFVQLPYLQKLELRSNALHGLIPVQIAEMPALRYLDLSFNELSGAIPEGLLGSGDPFEPVWPSIAINLSVNNLSGQLPLSLGRQDLAGLNVLQNPNLDGPIPHTYIQQPMKALRYSQTQICEPQDQEMQDWLDALVTHFSSRIPCEELPVAEPPVTPDYITASDGTSLSTVIVEWGTSEDADYYDLERSPITDAGLPEWSELATPKIPPYNDTDILPGDEYLYRVRACDTNGLCSSYTASDRGFAMLSSPEKVNLMLCQSIPSYYGCSAVVTREEEGEYLCAYWENVAGADFFRVYASVGQRYLPQFEGNEDLFSLYNENLQGQCTKARYIKDASNIIIGIQACTDITCGKVTLSKGTSHVIPMLEMLLLRVL